MEFPLYSPTGSSATGTQSSNSANNTAAANAAAAAASAGQLPNGAVGGVGVGGASSANGHSTAAAAAAAAAALNVNSGGAGGAGGTGAGSYMNFHQLQGTVPGGGAGGAGGAGMIGGVGGAGMGDENANFAAASQYPLSAASINAMMAGAQLPGGASGATASALTPSLAAQYSAATAGMFPSSMIGAAGAAMFPGGGGAMGMGGIGMGGMGSMGGMGGMGGMNMPSSNGMSAMAAASNSLGLSSAGGSMQNPAFTMAAAAAGGAIGGNGSTAGITGAGVSGAQPPPNFPSILSKYWNNQQILPTVLLDGTEPKERPYRDHARVPEDPSSRANNGRRSSKGGGSNFPAKLHDILSRTDITDIISWSPHGRAWRVLKPKAFEEKIIPKYFRHCKYNSFTRQVNGWGFRRITQGPDHNAYFHELFLRGLPHLCKRMRRLTASNSSRNDLVSNIEPDFYSMSKISPLPTHNIRTTPPDGGSGSTNKMQPQSKLFSEGTVDEISKNGETAANSTTGSRDDGTGDGADDDDPSNDEKQNGNNSDGSHSRPLDSTKKKNSHNSGVDGGGEASRTVSDQRITNTDHGVGAGAIVPRTVGASGNAMVLPDMMNEMYQLRGAGGVGGVTDPNMESNPNDFSQLDPVTRHQLLQAQYLSSMNMRQDTLQQQILAQQSLLSSLQSQGALSQWGGGLGVGGVSGVGIGMGVPGMSMGIPSNAQMSLMSAAGPGGTPFQMNGNQTGVLGNPNQNTINHGSNIPFY